MRGKKYLINVVNGTIFFKWKIRDDRNKWIWNTEHNVLSSNPKDEFFQMVQKSQIKVNRKYLNSRNPQRKARILSGKPVGEDYDKWLRSVLDTKLIDYGIEYSKNFWSIKTEYSDGRRFVIAEQKGSGKTLAFPFRFRKISAINRALGSRGNT